MTTVLAIATATTQMGVALGGIDGPIASLHVQQGRRHGELLAPAIESLTGMAGLSMSGIGRVAVDVGPGLFTGLRVGVATAKALASALEIPIVGCSSLDLLAYPHRREGRPVVAVVDARRGEVFWTLYRPGDHGAATAATVASPAALVEALRAAAGDYDAPFLAAGDGARRYADMLGAVTGLELAGPAFDHPSATVLVEVAASKPSVPLGEITPQYLRGADVRIGWETRPTETRPTETTPTTTDAESVVARHA